MWNRFIKLIQIKAPKNKIIDTCGGLKTDSLTVDGSMHEAETRMSKVHNKVGDSTYKQSKEAEYDFNVR